tara:strand:- start:223 stop:534 length:312 start_codon:yes stop_codon:yes gene_type:complete
MPCVFCLIVATDPGGADQEASMRRVQEEAQDELKMLLSAVEKDVDNLRKQHSSELQQARTPTAVSLWRLLLIQLSQLAISAAIRKAEYAAGGRETKTMLWHRL